MDYLKKKIKLWVGLKKDCRVFMGGIDAAGKTTILYLLKLGEVVTTIPTIGFNVETIQYKEISITAWDVGGCDKIRPLYRHYLQNLQVVIYVIDSADVGRMDEQALWLNNLLGEDEVRSMPVLLLANKRDLPAALPMDELKVRFKVDEMGKVRPVHMQPCVATTGEGLEEGLEWIRQQITGERPAGTAPEPPPSADTDATATIVVARTPPPAPKPSPLLPLTQQQAAAKVAGWLMDADDDDDGFLRGIEDCTGERWDHYAHLRLAWVLLHRSGRREGKERLFAVIKNYIEKAPGVAQRKSGSTFHETMTYFWMHMVHYAMASTPPAASQSFKAFLAANPHLADGGLFLNYYTRERMLQDPEARSQVLLSDLQPLPSIVAS